MGNGLIQWPEATYWTCQWNKYAGCRKVSPACEHCWAEAWAKRFHQSFYPHITTKALPPKKGVCFVGNLTDAFGEWRMPDEVSADIAECCMHPKAQYLWLTKRPVNMLYALEPFRGRLKHPKEFFGHQWFGFTAENQECFDERAKFMRDFPPWANMWLSAEPLLGPLAIGSLINNLKWVVVGAESGCDRRPCEIKWVEDLVHQCMSAKIPVFVKQLSINGSCVTDISRFSAHLRIRQVPWDGGFL